MKRILTLLFAAVAMTLGIAAQGWDDSAYRKIENSIHEPQFASRDFNITKYGAKLKATPAKNQAAINKARYMDDGSYHAEEPREPLS